MKEKIKSFFTKNIPWKILSLVLGFTIWGFISNAQDPEITRTLNIPVTYENEDALLEEGLVALTLPETASITVKVRSSNVNKLKADMFTCTADLVDHDGGDIAEQRVRIYVTRVSGSDVVLEWSYAKNDPNVIVEMDRYISKEFTVKTHWENRISEGLVIQNEPVYDPLTVTVSGPSSKFGNIVSVMASVNLRDFSDGGGTYTKELDLHLYDANENIIQNADNALSMSEEKATMTVTINRTQTVSLQLSGCSGEPAPGYRYVSSSVEPETVSVAGSKSIVADLTVLQLPPECVDITGLTESQDFVVDIRDYLPDGVTLATEAGEVTVHVDIEAVVTKVYEISAKDVSVTGERDGYSYEIRSSSLKYSVIGFQEDLDAFDIWAINPCIDVSGLEEGVSAIQVNYTAVPGYEFPDAEGKVIYVSVKAPEETTEPESSETEEPETKPTKESTEPESTAEPESTPEEPTESDSSSEEPTEPESTDKDE